MDYFIRATQQDWPDFLQLAVTLGILSVDEDGKEYAHGWDYIGLVYKPTGETVIVEGMETPLTAPVLAPDGQPYMHANLRTAQNLSELAEAHGVSLADFYAYILTDAEGNPTQPNTPARVFF